MHKWLGRTCSVEVLHALVHCPHGCTVTWYTPHSLLCYSVKIRPECHLRILRSDFLATIAQIQVGPFTTSKYESGSENESDNFI